MKGLGGRGQGKPGRGKGKGKGKGKDSGAGVGSTYANPGRPKSFQPTHQDRKQTGNIAEYFRRSDNTPKPTLVQIQGKDLEEVQLPDLLIEKLETMIKNKKKRAKNVRTSWSLEDKRTVLAVFKVLNRK